MLVELVGGEVVVEIACLAVVLRDGAVLVAGDDVLAKITPPGNGGLALVANDGHDLLIGLLGVDVELDIQHDNGAQVTHALLRYTQQPGAILVELDALDGRREVPRLEKLAGLDLPQADGVVGRAGGDDGRGGVDVDGPDGTLVALICAEPLAVVCEPGADVLILGSREEEIAFAVVPDRRARGQLGVPNTQEYHPTKLTVPSWGKGRKGGGTNLIWVKARSWPANKMGLILAVSGRLSSKWEEKGFLGVSIGGMAQYFYYSLGPETVFPEKLLRMRFLQRIGRCFLPIDLHSSNFSADCAPPIGHPPANAGRSLGTLPRQPSS